MKNGAMGFSFMVFITCTHTIYIKVMASSLGYTCCQYAMNQALEFKYFMGSKQTNEAIKMTDCS